MKAPLQFFFLVTCSYASPAPQNREPNGGPPSLLVAPLLRRISGDLQGIRSFIRQNQEQPLKRSELLLQNILPPGLRRPGRPRRPDQQENTQEDVQSTPKEEPPKPTEAKSAKEQANHPTNQPIPEKSENQPTAPPPVQAPEEKKPEKSIAPPPQTPEKSISPPPQAPEKSIAPPPQAPEKSIAPPPQAQDEKTPEKSIAPPPAPEEKTPEKSIAPPPSQPSPSPAAPQVEDSSGNNDKTSQPDKPASDDGFKRKIVAAPCLGGGGHDGSCRDAF